MDVPSSKWRKGDLLGRPFLKCYKICRYSKKRRKEISFWGPLGSPLNSSSYSQIVKKPGSDILKKEHSLESSNDLDLVVRHVALEHKNVRVLKDSIVLYQWKS